jgi:hypothetical protein
MYLFAMLYDDCYWNAKYDIFVRYALLWLQLKHEDRSRERLQTLSKPNIGG